MLPKLTMGDGPFGGPLSDNVRNLIRILTGDLGTAAPAAPVDDATVDLAVAEGLGPLLGARVAARKILVSEGRRNALLWNHQVCVADNLIRSRAIELLTKLFADRAIPLLLLKGMALIQSTFGAGERSMVDMDVLVPPSRWREACDLVGRAGYRSEPFSQRQFTVDNDYVRSFTNLDGVVIEVHRFVCEQTMFSIDYEGPDGIFARAHRLSAGALLPEDGDLFLTLAAHAAKHTFELPLRSYLDGLVLARRHDFSIASLTLRARAWRMENAFVAWMRSLRRLEGATESAAGPERPEHPLRQNVAERWSRFVWSRTSHSLPWQRFVRMAWLTDSAAEWTRHVAARSVFRVVDAVQSFAWSSGSQNDRGKGRGEHP